MKPYYEGWYMKQQAGHDILAVIPGRAQDEAFIQVVTSSAARYIPYPLDAFEQDDGIRIGKSRFTPGGMDLEVHEPDLELSGHLRYRFLTPLRYDIMGPFALLPLETKHTVFSMRHRVDGVVELNGESLRFDGSIGYMEGDRGHSFPRGYTWIQSVDFDRPASVMLAIAEIPLAGLRFTGCIGVVSIAGQEYRFATYLGVRIVKASETQVEVSQRDMELSIEVSGEHGHRLQAPMQGIMNRPIKESPAVPARFRFAIGGRTLLESDSSCTSFEYVAPHA